MTPILAGLQLYSVREAMLFDARGTIERVAEAGYRRAELWDPSAMAAEGRFYGLAADELRAVAEGSGLALVGAQVAHLADVDADRVLDFYARAGCTHVSIPIGYFTSADAVARTAAAYDDLGRRAHERGMRVLYVHHYHELETVEGVHVLDELLRRTTPGLVDLTLNPYWAARGLVDPLDLLDRYRERIVAVEQQDYPLDEIVKFSVWDFGVHHPIAARTIVRGRPLEPNAIENIHPVHCRLFTEVGTGVLKIRDLLERAASLPNLRYFFVRQDYTRRDSEFDSARVAREACDALPGLEW